MLRYSTAYVYVNWKTQIKYTATNNRHLFIAIAIQTDLPNLLLPMQLHN